MLTALGDWRRRQHTQTAIKIVMQRTAPTATLEARVNVCRGESLRRLDFSFRVTYTQEEGDDGGGIGGCGGGEGGGEGCSAGDGGVGVGVGGGGGGCGGADGGGGESGGGDGGGAGHARSWVHAPPSAS